MRVSGIANISESTGRKCAGERCPGSFLAETQTHVGLEGSEGRRLAPPCWEDSLAPRVAQLGSCAPNIAPQCPLKRSIFQLLLDGEVSSHLRGICFVCARQLHP